MRSLVRGSTRSARNPLRAPFAFACCEQSAALAAAAFLVATIGTAAALFFATVSATALFALAVHAAALAAATLLATTALAALTAATTLLAATALLTAALAAAALLAAALLAAALTLHATALVLLTLVVVTHYCFSDVQADCLTQEMSQAACQCMRTRRPRVAAASATYSVCASSKATRGGTCAVQCR
ncbi:hypothetical protein P8609_08290 [Lysobacter sp. UC]|uniref:Uncharacterized protein n=1 Tax=Lysobacter arvi TaxID=3038776 RepID=A0ABU1CCQ5_9GAMM|nr:hypothetical protein [Lysobacter arvi]